MSVFRRGLPGVLITLLCIGAGHAGQSTLALSMERRSPWDSLDRFGLELRSSSVLVVDEAGNAIYAKRTGESKSIASITKLMTAMVVLDTGLDLDAPITIRTEDRDLLRHSRSRMRVDRATLSRREMLLIALMSSENRAAAALGRTTFPGGTRELVVEMNRKAAELGMVNTRFADATGLDAENRSTAEDLILLIRAAAEYPLIRAATTRGEAQVWPYGKGGALGFRNTNPLVRSESWHVELSKTGYINEAGRCLVMQASIAGHRLYIVLLDSFGKLTPVGDSNRLRKWIERGLAAGPTG